MRQWKGARSVGEHAHERLVARASAGDDVVDEVVADARRRRTAAGERDAAWVSAVAVARMSCGES